MESQVLKQQSRSIKNHDRAARDREFTVGQPVFARQYLGPRKWVGGVISRQTGPLSYDVQVGDQISSTHLTQLLPSRAHHQDLSNQQLDQLYDDAEVRPEPETNMQAPLPQVTQSKIPEAPKVLSQQVPQTPLIGPPQERLPEVVIPKAASKKPEPAPQRTLRDRETLKPADVVYIRSSLPLINGIFSISP